MTTNHQGFAEPWQADLALTRVRRSGFPEHEWPDLLQELALKVGKFTFDDAKSNGAKESTVLRTVIDRHLATRNRSKRRAERSARKFRRCALHQGVCEDPIELRTDVRQLVGTLTPKEQAVCEGFGSGRSLAEIAVELACSIASVRRAKARIRKRFEEAGMKGWLDD
jgi:DNA-binding CsgD family transcriptional regulator